MKPRILVLKANYIIIILILFLSACASKKKQTSISNCNYSYINDYERATNHKQNYIIEGDTISLNIINFECTNSAFYTSWSMCNLYGDWDEGVKLEDDKFRTYLIWKNKDLLQDGSRNTIITCGQETKQGTTSAFMVLDEKGKDVLAQDTIIKQKYVDFFSKEIRKEKDKKMTTIFFQKYIKQFNPKYWKKYKKFPNVKIYIE